MASPAGSVQSVPSAGERRTRASVQPQARRIGGNSRHESWRSSSKSRHAPKPRPRMRMPKRISETPLDERRRACGTWSAAAVPPLLTAPARPAHSTIHSMMRERSEEHTSELQSRGLISYAVFCLKKKTPDKQPYTEDHARAADPASLLSARA